MKRPRNRSPRSSGSYRGWARIAAAAGAVLISAFLYQSGQMYLEKKASWEQTAQWRANHPSDKGLAARDRLEYEGKTYRRNTYVKAILCMGIDRQGSLEETCVAGSGGQADGIFLVAQDTARDQVRVLVIPRDTMTDITLTDLSGNVLGQGVQHLTLAYAYGDGREKSCEYMAEAVSGLLGGLPVDGYMAVSMSALPVINDGVGGVAVTIEDAGLERANSSFLSGETITLKGEQAEDYIRYRDTEAAQSALTRTERQKTYIKGFFHAAKDRAKEDDGFVSRLMKEIEPYMVTDMSKDRYMDMALAFLGGTQELGEADMVTLPGTAVETPIYDEYQPDKDKIMPIVLDLFYRPDNT